MKPVLASLLIAASPASASPAPSAADARAILRVVLAFETRVHSQAEVGPPPCVRRRIGRASLGDSRRAVEEAERPQPPRDRAGLIRSDPVTVVNSTEIRLSLFYRWRRLGGDHRGYVELGEGLTPEEERSLRAAERAAMVAPVQPRYVRRIDPAWIGPPLAFCAGETSWPYLDFGSPAFAGDFAFVRGDFECVLCGQGVMFALRRTRSGWEMVAAAVPWVS